MSIQQLCLIIVLTPLAGSIIAGFFRNQIGRAGAHSATILGVTISFIASLYVAWQIFLAPCQLRVQCFIIGQLGADPSF